MKIVYLGKKPGVHLTFKWLAASVMMVPKKPVEVADDDGMRLVADYPETFAEFVPDPLEQFIAENTPAESFDDEPDVTGSNEAQPPSEPAPMAVMAVALDDIEFEINDGKYLCPFCSKEYAATENGKPWMIKHLESKHAEDWAKALEEKKG
jgi:hypothetical protein